MVVGVGQGQVLENVIIWGQGERTAVTLEHCLDVLRGEETKNKL